MRLYVLCFAFLLAAFQGQAQTYAIDYTVPMWAVPLPGGGIELHWKHDSLATGWQISRKIPSANTWGVSVASLPGTDSVWSDPGFSLGNYYEYKIRKSTTNYTGYGYVLAGNERPAVEQRGRIVVVLDTLYKNDLASELYALRKDLLGDGWEPEFLEVDRNDAVADVKNRLVALHTASPLTAIFLVGHVPVPYSGNLNPDAHPDHKGAWPADAFYGDMDGGWGDFTVNTTSASRPANHNIPGDGKYDPSILPSDVDVQVGRVDFYDMPAFTQTELQLLQRYFAKDHAWRHKERTALAQGVVDDNFGVFTYTPPNPNEYFAASGWRNFAPLVGAGNVFSGDFRTSLATSSYIWAYGCGGGSYTSCSGVGTTANFAADSLNGVFSLLFGSYFGDWDSQNNLLRAVIAAKGMTLTSTWAGRPQQFFHPAGLGETMGYGIRISQNNSTLYDPGYFARNVHIALMGDPSLREHVLAPPQNLTVTTFSGGRSLLLNWTASPDSVLGYHIYGAANEWGPYFPIDTFVQGTQYSDNCLAAGVHYYMVRAVELRECPSGSYYNLSQGVFGAGNANNNFSMNVGTGLDTILCVGQPFSVQVQEVDVPCSGNLYRVALSDSLGDFASPTAIGYSSGLTITCTVPIGTPLGSGYRIRIGSSAPNLVSADNGFDLWVMQEPFASFSAVVYGDSLDLQQLSTGNWTSQFWDFGNGDTSQAVLPSYQYPVSGNYVVTLVLEGPCGQDMAQQTVSAIGVEDGLNPFPLTIWPNPATEFLRFEAQMPIDCQWKITVRDLYGRIIETQQGTSNRCVGQFDLRELSSGTYFLELDAAGQKNVVKFWKE